MRVSRAIVALFVISTFLIANPAFAKRHHTVPHRSKLSAPLRKVARDPDVHSDRVTLTQLGYHEDLTENGIYPNFLINIPKFPSLRAMSLDLRLRVSPLADPHSSINILVNGRPTLTRYVRDIGRDVHLVVPLPLPPSQISNIAITIKAYLYVSGDLCTDQQTSGLYLILLKSSAIDVQATSGSASILDFFRGYGSRIAVVAPQPTLAHPGIDVIGLPYHLRQIETWHQPDILLVPKVVADARNIIIRSGRTQLDRRRLVLRVAPEVISSMRSSSVQAMIGSRASDMAVATELDSSAGLHHATLADLGIRDQTRTAYGEMVFPLPLFASSIGGIPQDLQFHAVVAHTPLLGSNAGMLQVQLNGRLIASRELSKVGQTEALDVSIPQESLSPVNDVRVIVSYFTGAGQCVGSLATMTASLLDSSYFSWGHVDTQAASVSDFIKVVSGRVIVLVGNKRFVPAAFHFMSELGGINGRISRIAIEPFTGHVPIGYDYAIVLADPEQLRGLPVPVQTAKHTFTIVNPIDHRVEFSATEDRPLATIQTAQLDRISSLVFSYYLDPRALHYVEHVGGIDLVAQSGNVVLVTDTLNSYDVGEKMRVSYASDNWTDKLWLILRLPLAMIMVVIMVLGILYAARRLTGTTAPA